MFERGDLLLVPFPFSDLSATKRRPVLTLGTPEDIAGAKRSDTGQFPAPVLTRRQAKRKARTEAAE